MPVSVDNSVLDGALAVIATGNALHVVTGNPTTRSQVLSNSLADIALDAGDFSAPGNATPDGRFFTVAGQTEVPVDATGTPTHYVIIDSTKILLKTPVGTGTTGLTSGSTTVIEDLVVRIPAAINPS